MITWNKRLGKEKEPLSKPCELSSTSPKLQFGDQGEDRARSPDSSPWIQLAQMVLDGCYGQKWPDTVFQVPDACPICLTPIHKQERTQCGHVFHKKCLLQHLDIRNTCPIYRALLIDP
ncbi:hypothetical protein TNCV_1728861 [Trichonephila clavipes]|nr:hypothetical protein TNCV_1728861 [Trichonephila clavipes]